jgi:LmbE family N-acetylglucosaminyl deacetylase
LCGDGPTLRGTITGLVQADFVGVGSVAVSYVASHRHGVAQSFLRRLANPELAEIAAEDVAVAVAHPDDETIGCGAQLSRLKEVTVIVVTDGAPRDSSDSDAEQAARQYATVRRRELGKALAIPGIPEEAVHRLDIPDQGATQRLPEIVRWLAEIFRTRNIRLVLTHAYEGSHPDHDSTAFAVHAAAKLVARTGATLAIIEMPFYFDGPSGLVTQQFTPVDDLPEVGIRLTEAEQIVKRKMFASHWTQRDVLALFATDMERFRDAPAYDFTKAPFGRDERWYGEERFGMTGTRWLSLVGRALTELDLKEGSWA